MTVRVHLEQVVVDGPLPGGQRQWRLALERELAAALAGTPAGLVSGWPASGQHLVALPPAYGSNPGGVGTYPSVGAVAGALGAALATGGRT